MFVLVAERACRAYSSEAYSIVLGYIT